MGEAISPLARWESFYVIVGSSAGALTGLQFVVIALIAEAEAAASMQEIRAFGTPTVVHFCAVLFISAVLSAPWHTLDLYGIANMRKRRRDRGGGRKLGRTGGCVPLADRAQGAYAGAFGVVGHDVALLDSEDY